MINDRIRNSRSVIIKDCVFCLVFEDKHFITTFLFHSFLNSDEEIPRHMNHIDAQKKICNSILKEKEEILPLNIYI